MMKKRHTLIIILLYICLSLFSSCSLWKAPGDDTPIISPGAVTKGEDISPAEWDKPLLELPQKEGADIVRVVFLSGNRVLMLYDNEVGFSICMYNTSEKSIVFQTDTLPYEDQRLARISLNFFCTKNNICLSITDKFYIYDFHGKLCKEVILPEGTYMMYGNVKVAFSDDLSLMAYVLKNRLILSNLDGSNVKTIKKLDASNIGDLSSISSMVFSSDNNYIGFDGNAQNKSDSVECFGRISINDSKVDMTVRPNISSQFSGDLIFIGDANYAAYVPRSGTVYTYNFLANKITELKTENINESEHAYLSSDNQYIVGFCAASDALGININVYKNGKAIYSAQMECESEEHKALVLQSTTLADFDEKSKNVLIAYTDRMGSYMLHAQPVK